MKRSLIALALASLLPLSAQADDKLSYTYVEADYVNVDSDADGFGFRGSFEFGESGFYGFGGYNTVEIDGTSIDVDTYDRSDFSGDFSGTIGGQYKFGQTWGVVGEVEFADGGETYLLGLRASF